MKELDKFLKPRRNVTMVFLHCSASDHPEDDNPETIDKWHKARGWSGIGYHIYVDKQGKVFKCRDLEHVPAAQQGFNTGAIAICCGGLKTFTDPQMEALKDLCNQINKAYFGKITFHGHKEVNSLKSCPVYDYRKLLSLIDKGTKFEQRGYMQ